jgi:transcription-repair coupling factor (superfamily II helicase)
MQILIPKYYISVTTERLSLYKELDNIGNEEGLLRFEKHLTDRFGRPPTEVYDLFNTIRLRWMAKKIGFEKLTLKNGRLFGYFVGDENSSYYQSSAFTHILNYMKNNPVAFKMDQTKSKLRLIFDKVETVRQAIMKIKPLVRVEG